MKIRVRYAPSPTGDPHIGNIRTALFNWLFARQNAGDFIVRIEDTDVKRAIPKSVEKIFESLEWLGLNWDEEPCFQSKRLVLYKKYVRELLDNDKAYYCFCTPEELEKQKEKQKKAKQPPMYNRKCRDLIKKQIEQRIKKKIPYVVRLKVPLNEEIEFKDLIKGKIKFDSNTIDDQVLLKSDGYPTYHLASIIDDHLMEISHVIRGDDWLPSAPKHVLLYQAFNWQPPKFAHLPLTLGPNGEKLSKRHGAMSILEYKDSGYLPEALINFMALLGWNPDTEQEIFSKEELIKKFSLGKIQKTNAVFNIKKLDWLNGFYLRQMNLDELTKRIAPFLEKINLIEIHPVKSDKVGAEKFNGVKDEKYAIKATGETIGFDELKKIVFLEKERIKRLSQVGEVADFFFLDKLEYQTGLLAWKGQNKENIIKNLSLAKDNLSLINKEDWNKIKLEEILMPLTKMTGVGDLLWPLRVSLTGKEGSPSPFEIAEILGKEKTLKRICQAIEKLKI
ncbi:MAG: glutamyl-tRNA synthetase [Parcubacteria group bacterium Athens1014_10]|nr:MAG: glutamyl-tRNA synthetase [Parcubacteria group bacterium Athens1014_10]TSD06033.1 MAG: glutamyl-tRNA synthetase [Parcubacteria group bacterium Athens0714_12]